MIYNISNVLLLRKFSKISATFFYIVALSILLSSCHKSDSLGDKIISSEEFYKNRTYVFSSFSSATILDTAIVTDTCRLNYLGTYTDENLGKLDASFMTQFVLNEESNNKDVIVKNNVTSFDSVLLQIEFSTKSFGNFSDNIRRLKIIELTKEIDVNTTYYNITDEKLFTSNGTILYDGDVNIDASKASKNNFITLKLPTNYFNDKLKNYPTKFNEVGLKDIFKGLYIMTTSANQTIGSGNIASFNLLGTQTKLSLYFHVKEWVSYKDVKMKVDLKVDANCKRINLYKSTISSKINTLNLDTDNIYLQGFGVSNGNIDCMLNNLFKDSLPTAIVHAEIEIPVNTDKMSSDLISYPYPSKLKLKYRDSNDKLHQLFDEGEIDGYAVGGNYNSQTKNYKFVITRTLQQILISNLDVKGFFITCDDRSNSPRKVVLKGGNNIKLTIKYTKF